MSMEKWYRNYRDKIKKARTDMELDSIIDAIFDEGVEIGREEPFEKEHDSMWADLD